MKVILVVVILHVGFHSVLGRPEDNESSVDVVKSESQQQTDPSIGESSNEDVASVKTKRGILHYDLGHPHLHAHAHAAHTHLHGVNYAVPFGLHKHALSTPYARFPGVYRSLYSPTGHVALTHGGASVQSYSVNYHRVPIVHARPALHHHHHVPLVPVARPAFVPVQQPLLPSPAVVVPQRPIIPVAVPSFAHHHHHHRVPVFVQRPQVFVPRPVTPVVAQQPIVPAVAPAPVFPTASIPHVHQHVHPWYHPQIPQGLPQLPIQPIQPQFIPFPAPAPLPTLPTPIGPPLVPEALPQPGATVFTSAPQPGGWRPIIVTAPVPSFAPPSGHTPTQGLLPPFEPSPTTTTQTEIQPAGAGEQPIQTPLPQTPSTLYLSPGEVNQLDNANNANYQHYSDAAQEIANSHGTFY